MSRAWLQRARRQRLEAKNRHAKTCQRSSGRRLCGGPLRDVVDRVGRLVRQCDHCERRKAGVCRLCPCAVDGRVGSAIYCARCRGRVERQYSARYVQTHAAQHRASARESWRRRSGYYEKRGLVPPPTGVRARPAAAPWVAPSLAGGIQSAAHREKIGAGVKAAWARRREAAA